MLVFDQQQRDDFAALVRAQELDERLAADEASRLATAWLADLPTRWPAELLGRAVGCKLAGYNADLHAWTIRVQRATRAASRFLREAKGVDFRLDDMRLGEYFMLAWARSRGMSVRLACPAAPMLEGLLERHPPQCLREGHETFEFDMGNVLEHAGRGRDLPDRLGTLFVATMETYLNPMIPVMRELLARGQRVALLAPDAGTHWSASREIPLPVERLRFDDLMTRRDAMGIRAQEKQVQAWLARTEDTLATRFTSAGVDLWPLVAPDVHEVARIYLPMASWLIDAGRRLAQDHGVGTLVCARLRRCAESALASGVQKGGGRCLVIPHGHVGQSPTRRFIDGPYAWADRVCTWGDEQRRQILDKREGVRPERVVVTGNPGWDALTPPIDRPALRRDVCSVLGLDATRGSLFVYATQADGFSQAAHVVRTLLETPNAQVVIKVHPREERAPYDTLVRGCNRAVVVHGNEPRLHDLLAAADAVLTFHSTTNIESLLLGTPVISVALGELAGVDRLIELERWGLPLATDAKALHAFVRACDADPVAFRLGLGEAMANAAQDIAGGSGASARIATMIVGGTRVAEAA